METLPIANTELCSRPESTKFKGKVLYTEPQLRQFGLIVEGAERRINHVIILSDTGVKSHATVVSEVKKSDDGIIETRLHPTHPSLIEEISREVVIP